MDDPKRQTAAGKVMLHFSMSLDGFIWGPDVHSTDWMAGVSSTPGLDEKYLETTGAILGGRKGWDAYPDPTAPYGGWRGPLFILTHHPEDAQTAEGVTFLTCDVAEAARIGLEAAGGKNLEIFSASIGRQLLERGLIDEIELHILPVLLGDGIRLYDNPGGSPVPLEMLDGDDPKAEVYVRYRPVATGSATPEVP